MSRLFREREPCGLPTPESTHSFWHSQPSELLLGHRSTRDLPKAADVVIIGSGMTGTSVAHHLLTECGSDCDVVMLEAREACWGATGRNGGHCAPTPITHPQDPSIGYFELDNYRTLQSLIKDKNIDCEFVPQAGVHALYDTSILSDAEFALSTMQTTAPDLAKIIHIVTDRMELERLRIPSAVAAVIIDVAARMWPYKFVARILEDLLTAPTLRGTFNLQTFTPVTSIAPLDDERWTVTTPRGCIVASKLVLATNAYTSHLLPSFADLIVPCRGQMSALEPPPSVARQNRLKASYGFMGKGTDDYLVQRPNEDGGHLMYGGGRQEGRSLGVSDDSVINEPTARYLRSQLIDSFHLPNRHNSAIPSVTLGRPELTAAYEWTGIMGYSRDDTPWVGPVPGKPSLYMAAGFTGHGMPNTWLCGKAIALMVEKTLGEGVAVDGVQYAIEKTGLPQCYIVSKTRMQQAMDLEHLELRDWAELERNRRRKADRPHSGYA